MAPSRKNGAPVGDNDVTRKKPVRRDMDKRREQNRQSQRTYREKQRKRIEQLERLAAATTDSENVTSTPVNSHPGAGFDFGPVASTTSAPGQNYDLIDPTLLSLPSTSQDLIASSQHISPANFLQLATYMLPEDSDVFFDCGCSTLHVPAPASPFLLPVRPRSFSMHANTLRLDFECTLSALLRNCLHLGISKSQFCADESESLFYRPLIQAAEDSEGIENEARDVVVNTLALFRTVKHDLQPLDSQVKESHHPYIDVLPFPDLRANLVAMQGRIDEDEFLHDWFNQAKCWGGAKGSKGGGMPWEGRNWEVTEDFLRKWAVVTGGDEGELARGSRWWRAMRGERVEEVL